MADLYQSHSCFYQQALNLFKEAGHAATDVPIYCNHSAEQTVYFDAKVSVALSKEQRYMLQFVTNISYLFYMDDDVFLKRNNTEISFYSMELLTSKSFRSQVAYDIHEIMHQTITSSASVLLFKNDNNVMLSFAGFALDITLSNWYDFEDEFDLLVDIIDIANMTLHSSQNYFFDFVYCSARWYYKEPISGDHVAYSMLPAHYCTSIDSDIDTLMNREEKMDFIRTILHAAENEYGDDYVVQTTTPTSNFDIELELDLLDLDIGLDDEDEPHLVEDYLGYGAYEDDMYEERLTKREDKYELDGIDPEIFKDPALMVKWLNKNNI